MLFFISLISCSIEEQNFSIIPNLTLSKVEQVKREGKDSIVFIDIEYSDGDGNIGLEANDTFPPFNFPGKYSKNLFINVFKIENGVTLPIIIPLTTDTINFNDRIKNLTPTGKNKSIKGVLKLNLNPIPFPGVFPDSMFYTVQIIDRALNFSNVVSTPILKFSF